MASVSITNQTLTMTITIDGVDTVIRKDNCKVQAFGDVVRITDYKGSIYEFLFSDCTSPSEASANALRDAIEEFLNTGGGGGGGGITSITSTDGSIDIDNTDPTAPDLSIPHGTWTPVFSQETANITASDSSGASTYFRVGDIVFFTMTVSVGVSSGVTGSFESSIPIASVFNSGAQGSIGIAGRIFSEDLGFIKRFDMLTSGNDGGLLFEVDWQNDSSGGFVIQIVGQYNVQTA